jgi:hypothetical protein
VLPLLTTPDFEAGAKVDDRNDVPPKVDNALHIGGWLGNIDEVLATEYLEDLVHRNAIVTVCKAE